MKNHWFISIVLFVSAIAGCDNNPEKKDDLFPDIEILDRSETEILVSNDSGILAQPVHIEFTERGIYIFDAGYGKMIVLDERGEKQFEFGKTGDGPGEFSAMSGLNQIEFGEGQILGTDPDQLDIELYDLHGNALKSFKTKEQTKYFDLTYLGKYQVFLATEGRFNSLAVIKDLKTDSILHRIGEPMAQPEEVFSPEEDRISYSNGIIPDHEKNRALVEILDDHYVLFMQTLGQLRFYTKDGELIYHTDLPEVLKSEVFSYIVQQNKDGRPYVVMPLQYAGRMKVYHNKVYLLIPDFDMEGNQFETQLIIFDEQGVPLAYKSILNGVRNAYLNDFTIDDNGDLLLVDYMNAEILKFRL